MTTPFTNSQHSDSANTPWFLHDTVKPSWIFKNLFVLALLFMVIGSHSARSIISTYLSAITTGQSTIPSLFQLINLGLFFVGIPSFLFFVRVTIFIDRICASLSRSIVTDQVVVFVYCVFMLITTGIALLMIRLISAHTLQSLVTNRVDAYFSMEATILYSDLSWMVFQSVHILNYLSRATLSTSIQLATPLSSAIESYDYIIAHWTDLHLTGIRARTMEGKLAPGAAFRNLVSRHSSTLECVDAILVTGDITDSGAQGEWKEFFEILPQALLSKIVLLPGNHDINMPHHSNFLRAEDVLDNVTQQIRYLRFLFAVNLLQGNRSWVLLNNTIRQFHEWMAANSVQINEFLYFSGKRKKKRRQWEKVLTVPEYLLHSAFPMVVGVNTCDLRFVLLNSNGKSSNILTNAFGHIGNKQLEQSDKLLSLIREPFVVALHHHLGVPVLGNTIIQKLIARSMALDDGGALLSIMARKEKAFSIFNGHRHISYDAQVDNIQIYSGPSTTLGDELCNMPRPTFGLYYLTKGESGVSVRAREWLL